MFQYLESVTSIAYHMISTLQYELLFSALLFVGFLCSRDQDRAASKAVPKGGVKRSGSELAQQIVDMSGTKYSKAMDVFLSRPTADFESATVEQYMNAVTSLAVASVRVGRLDRLPGIFVRLQQREGRDPELLATLTRMLASRRQHEGALRVYESWKGIFREEVPSCALSCLILSAADVGKTNVAEEWLAELSSRGEAGPRDYAALVRVHAAQEQPDKALAVLREMEAAGVTPDNISYNIVLSACSGAQKRAEVSTLLARMPDADVVTYNTQLKSCVQDRDVPRAFQLFKDLEAAGLVPTQVTYGTLLECCTRAGEMDKAQDVLQLMAAKNVPRNAVVYTSIISGLTGLSRLDDAVAVFEEMRADPDVEPDVICFSVLIKALCDYQRLDSALKLLEELLQLGQVPDEILFNNLLSGCAQKPHVQLGERVFQDMLAQGIRPTVATFSIMVKLYLRAGEVQASADFLARMPEAYKMTPAPRLYMQHIMYCIRARKGASVLEVYELMACRCKDASCDAVLSACRSFNLLDTAVELLEVGSARVSPSEIRATLELLERKHKSSLLERVHAVLKK